MNSLYCFPGKLCLYISCLILYLLFCAGKPANGQNAYVLQGRIVSADNQEPLVGASVLLKGSNNGKSSDKNGLFNLSVPGDRAALVLSFIGYRSVDTVISFPLRQELTIALSPDAAALDETIIIGYGTTTKKLNTGNVGRITAQEIARQPVGNPLAALAGRIPGLVITPFSGLPGSNYTVAIRGQNSISNGNEPFYIVDGVPYVSNSMSQVNGTSGQQSPFSSINPSDIESIEVLKDADATAIYGSRGSNGVILITTKKGKEGKTRAELTVYKGIGHVTRTMELMSTDQYLAMRREAFANDGIAANITNAPDLLSWDPKQYTDWKKLLIGNAAQIQDVQLALSGGTGSTQLRLSGGFHRETTVFPGSLGSKRGSMQLSVGHRSSDNKFQANFTANYSASSSDMIPADITGSIYSAPNTPVNSNDGSGPLAGILTLRQSFQNLTHSLVSNLSMFYHLSADLSLKLSGGYTKIDLGETAIYPGNSYAVARPSGNSAFGQNNFQSWLAEPQLLYTKKLGNGKLDGLLGASWQQDLSDRTVVNASGYSSEMLLGTPSGASVLTVSANNTQYRYQAAFARLNYNYGGRYIVNLTGRRDGSSRFGPGRKFATFGAVGAAWLFSEETFVSRALPFLSFGKIRASYGVTGNDKIGDYQYLDTYASAQYPYQGVSGLLPTRLFNADYGWETNYKLEWAMDLGFVHDRIRLSVSQFTNRSSNQLLSYVLPVQTGFSGITRNLPAAVKNKGWEFELQTVNIQKKNLRWNTAVNLSVARNELTKFDGLENSSYASRYQIGEPLNIKKLYHYLGVDPQTGTYSFDLEQGQNVVRDMSPTFYGGFSSDLHYKRLELNLFFQFSKRVAPTYLYSLTATPGLRGYNQPVALLDRWQQPADQTDIQRFTTGAAEPATAYGTYYRNSDAAYLPVSFLRLKNVSLSCDLIAARNKKTFIERCSIFIRCQNLFTLTNYQGNDPEVTNMSTLPPLRTLTAGLQFTF